MCILVSHDIMNKKYKRVQNLKYKIRIIPFVFFFLSNFVNDDALWNTGVPMGGPIEKDDPDVSWRSGFHVEVEVEVQVRNNSHSSWMKNNSQK